MSHKIKTVVQVGGRNYTSPAMAAARLAHETADRLAQPKYNDSNPRQSWDCSLFHTNFRRIEKRAYDRFHKVCVVLMK